jgi:hypothetical protein
LPGPTSQFLICFIPDWIGHGSYGLLCRQGLRKGCGTVSAFIATHPPLYVLLSGLMQRLVLGTKL